MSSRLQNELLTPDGKHCPECKVDIGVWPVFSAVMPHLIRCPHCKARLVYQDTWQLTIFLILLGAGIALSGYFIAGYFREFPHLLSFTTFMFVAWIPVELVVAWYLRANKVLKYQSGGTPSAH